MRHICQVVDQQHHAMGQGRYFVGVGKKKHDTKKTKKKTKKKNKKQKTKNELDFESAALLRKQYFGKLGRMPLETVLGKLVYDGMRT